MASEEEMHETTETESQSVLSAPRTHASDPGVGCIRPPVEEPDPQPAVVPRNSRGKPQQRRGSRPQTSPTARRPSSSASKTIGADSSKRAKPISLRSASMFDEFKKKLEDDMDKAKEMRRFRLMSRHSARYIQSHEHTLSNEFDRFKELEKAAEKQQEKLRKLKGGLQRKKTPGETAMLMQRAVADVVKGPPVLDKVTQEFKRQRRGSSIMLLRRQLEKITDISVKSKKERARKESLKITRWEHLESKRSSGEKTPSGESDESDPGDYSDSRDLRRSIFQGLKDRYGGGLQSSRASWTRMTTPKVDWRKEAELDLAAERDAREELRSREEEMLDRLCLLTPNGGEQPWIMGFEEESVKHGKNLRFRSPSFRPAKLALQMDAEFAAQWQAKRKTSLLGPRKPARSISSRLGKRKRRHTGYVRNVPWDAKDNTLCSELLLQEGGVADAGSLRYLSLENLGIGHVDPFQLNQFTSLRCLDLSGNYVPLKSLAPLISLRKLILQCNQQFDLVLPQGSFELLEVLDVSYNFLEPMALVALSSIPALRKLNMDYNDLEMIPDEINRPGAFPRLEMLCVAGNCLSSLSLLPLSKVFHVNISRYLDRNISARLPWLQKLNLQGNKIRGLPHQMNSNLKAFWRLLTLDLASNPIENVQRLVPLRCLSKLSKVILWDTPLANLVSFDASGRCLPRSVPVLQAAIQAQKAGQHWFLEKPDSSEQKTSLFFERLPKRVTPPQRSEPGMFNEETMVAAFDKVYDELLRKDSVDEHVRSGITSTSMPIKEGAEAEVTITDTGALSSTLSYLPETTVTPRSLMHEELQRIERFDGPKEPHLSESMAAVTKLRLALKMIPFREVDLDPPRYRRPTKQGVIRKHQARTSAQPPPNPWKEAVQLARTFSDRTEKESKAQVRHVLESMGSRLSGLEYQMKHFLQEIKTPIKPPSASDSASDSASANSDEDLESN